MDAYDLFDARERQRERDAALDAIEERGDWYADLFARMRTEAGERPPALVPVIGLEAA